LGKVPRKAAAETGTGNRLSDLAYTRLLELLFEKRLPAGSFVTQSELVELTGVPVAPMRDALRILAAEGIVTIHPRTGIEFVRPGLELTRATYQFRGIIEAAAVATYAETASDLEIADMERRHQQVVADVESAGLTPEVLLQLEELETLLHGSIVASLKNALIDTSYRRVRNYLRLIRLDRRLTTPLALRSLREHLTIIQACRRRDTTQAVLALREHFASALQRSLGLY
jgi:DNA-binding GntR family transcriptional regulator